MAEEEPRVELVCIQEARGRLRVRIVTPGYFANANCQFPRAIRREGCRYTAPAAAITLAQGRAGKYFYRVSAKSVTVLDEVPTGPDGRIHVDRIYQNDEDDTCIVCFDAVREFVIVPCGHYNLCGDCSRAIQADSCICPTCRGRIVRTVTIDQIG